MVFSSLIFLYAFFSLSLLAYALCRGKKAQNISLLIFSLIFYTWGEPKYVLLLMFMSFTSWVCALKVEKASSSAGRRVWLVVSCLVDIGLIGFFKYSSLICSLFGPVPEFVENIALPIGISFYTFQLLTYVVDVYRAQAKAQRSYWNVLLYASLFHQCIAGPIVRYGDISEELFGEGERKGELAEGAARFSIGLAKKALLANPCGALAESQLLSDAAIGSTALFAENLEALSSVSVLGAWLGVIAYALHIYLDFSAYSDMAIGMGKMLGLHYPENFNYPYISKTATEFWRRWHISLSGFFRDYVYIPLGGSRVSLPRSVLNTFVVWALTGLWHGASWNFLLWGLWFFLLLMLERAFLGRIMNRLHILPHLYLLFAVLLGWVIFKYTDLRLCAAMLRSLFGANGNELSSFTAETLAKNNLFLLIVSAIVSTPLGKKLSGWLASAFGGGWDFVRCAIIPAVLLLLSTAALVGNSYNPFIYFQF